MRVIDRESHSAAYAKSWDGDRGVPVGRGRVRDRARARGAGTRRRAARRRQSAGERRSREPRPAEPLRPRAARGRAGAARLGRARSARADAPGRRRPPPPAPIAVASRARRAGGPARDEGRDGRAARASGRAYADDARERVARTQVELRSGRTHNRVRWAALPGGGSRPRPPSGLGARFGGGDLLGAPPPPTLPCSRSTNPRERIRAADPRLRRGTSLKASASRPQLLTRRRSALPRRATLTRLDANPLTDHGGERRMATRVGINGFGRIGRNFFRAQQQRGADIEIVAVNDLGDAKTMAHLLKYDSVLGPFPGDVELGDGVIRAGGEEMKMLSERDPAALPWGDLGVDVVLESTGFFTDREGAQKHLDAGAKKVLISAPATDPDVTRRPRRQRRRLRPGAHHIVSNASCTTNCVAPLAKVLDDLAGHRVGLHDDDPRVHERPEHPRPAAQGPPARARGGDQPDPDLDRGREGDRARPPAPAGEGRRHLGPRAGADRVAHRPRRDPRSRR